jgi:tetratricopeptide (TPR) repeat protein
MGRLSALLTTMVVIVTAPMLRGEHPKLAPLGSEGLPDPLPVVVSDSHNSAGPEVVTLPSPARDPNFYFQRGMAAFGRNDYDVAIADFDEALRLNPTVAVVYYTRGLTYYLRAIDPHRNDSEREEINADYDRALGDLFDAILRDPAPIGPYLVRARVFASNRFHRFDRARDDYNTVLRSDPMNADALKERGNLKKLELDFTKQQSQKDCTGQTALSRSDKSPLAAALEQAAIEEVIARQEKAKWEAEQYRRARLTLAPAKQEEPSQKKVATKSATGNAPEKSAEQPAAPNPANAVPK